MPQIKKAADSNLLYSEVSVAVFCTLRVNSTQFITIKISFILLRRGSKAPLSKISDK